MLIVLVNCVKVKFVHKVVIKTILVDYAGVLTETRDNSLFSEKYSDFYGLKPKELMDVFYENWGKAAVASISSTEFWSIIAQRLKVDIVTLKQQVLSTYPLNQQLINFLEQRRQKFNLVMVSNQIEDWIVTVFKQNQNLKEMFNLTANSYEVGVRKPNRKIFTYTLNLAQSSPRETLFIDDSSVNIQAANKLGIKTIQYTNFLTFQQQFNRLLENS